MNLSPHQAAIRSTEAIYIGTTCSTLTDVNMHTEALLELAATLPDCGLQLRQLREIQTHQGKAGYLPTHLEQWRSEIANKLWKRARAYWPDDNDYQTVRKGF